MPQQNDLSRSLTPFEHTTTLVAVIELSQSSWLIAGTIPGIERQPIKKIVPDETGLLRVLHRWRDEGIRKGLAITRIGWCRKCFRAICVIAGRSAATPGSPARRMKAAPSDVRKVSPSRATPGCAAA